MAEIVETPDGLTGPDVQLPGSVLPESAAAEPLVINIPAPARAISLDEKLTQDAEMRDMGSTYEMPLFLHGGRLSLEPRLPPPEPPVTEDTESSFLEDVGDVLTDVGEGILEAPEAVVRGVSKGVTNIFTAADDLANWLNENVANLEVPIPLAGIPAVDEFLANPAAAIAGPPGVADELTDEPTSVTGSLVQGISQFLTGYQAKGLKAVARASTSGIKSKAVRNIAEPAIRGAGADPLVFDPHEARLSDLLREHWELNDPITAYLASSPEDTAAEGRLKNALEGLVLGVGADVFIRGLIFAVRVSKAKINSGAKSIFSAAVQRYREGKSPIPMGMSIEDVGGPPTPGQVSMRGKRQVLDVPEPFTGPEYGVPGSRKTMEVIVNPSKGDILRQLRQAERRSGDRGLLRYAVDEKTKNLYIWDALRGVHRDIEKELGIPAGDKKSSESTMFGIISKDKSHSDGFLVFPANKANPTTFDAISPGVEPQEVRTILGEQNPITDASPGAIPIVENATANAFLVQPLPTFITGTGGKSGTKVTPLDIGNFWDQDYIARFGRQGDPSNPDDFAVALRNAEAEVRFQLNQVETGEGWYDADLIINRSVVDEVFGDVLRTRVILNSDLDGNGVDPEYMHQLLLAISAPLSFNTRPKPNMNAAMKVFDITLETGTIPHLNPETGKLWTSRKVAGQSLQVLQSMIDQLGVKNAMKWLFEMHTIQAIRAMKRSTNVFKDTQGMSISGDEASTRMGAFILGPKGGSFFLNINRIDDTTTDLWDTRSFNRHFGRMTSPGAPGQSGLLDQPRNLQQRGQQKDFNAELASKFSKTERDAQAIRWYYEQNVFAAMGQTSARPSKFSEGAIEFRDNIGRRATRDSGGTVQPVHDPGSRGRGSSRRGERRGRGSTRRVAPTPSPGKGGG